MQEEVPALGSIDQAGNSGLPMGQILLSLRKLRDVPGCILQGEQTPAVRQLHGIIERGGPGHGYSFGNILGCDTENQLLVAACKIVLFLFSLGNWHLAEDSMPDPLKWYDDKADNPEWIKALAEVRHRAAREGWCYQHVQAIIVAIDQYAEKALGNRDFFLNKPHSIGDSRKSDIP
jgi:hypothetical protein